MPRKDLLDIINQHKKESKKSLDLSINGIIEKDLDDSIIEELKYFIEIDLSGNMLKGVPNNFINLKKLKKLTLATNYIKVFPKEITLLTNLETLDLRDNLFNTVHLKLNNLKKLKFLYLKGNPLKKIPKVIFDLTNLEVLGLVNTQLSLIPNEINRLEKLKSLWIGKNRIKKLPNGLIKLKSLQNITLDENPLPIPKNILNDQKSTDKIFEYYKKYQQYMLEQVYESKIIIVGESQAGKTSLLNRLIYNRFYTDESKTENINIDDWNIHLKDKVVTVNLWDFGGQDILYSLHKFFLTDNCIYILVWDSRNENKSRKIEQWLKTISHINKDSKVLLVMNKIDEHNTSINKVYLNKIIPNIKYYNISCKYNWNIDKLETDIKELLETDTSLVFHYSKKFLNIKKELKEKKEPHITLQEFDTIIDKNQLLIEEKSYLFNTFKNLGLILHYEDNFRLQNLLLLDTNWFVEGIYTVINWISKVKTNGSFTFDDLNQIFSESNYKYTHEVMIFIIDSLLHFNIIFEINKIFYFPNLLEYFDKDIEQIVDKEFSKFRLSTKDIENDYFYELLVKYANQKNITSFWRNLISIQYNQTDIFLHLTPNKKIFIYINKSTHDSISNIIEFLIEDFKSILDKIDVDLNILLSDKTQVSISYLKYLKKCGYKEYISQKHNKYTIDNILGDSKINDLPTNSTNIYINQLDGDILGDYAKKEIK